MKLSIRTVFLAAALQAESTNAKLSSIRGRRSQRGLEVSNNKRLFAKAGKKGPNGKSGKSSAVKSSKEASDKGIFGKAGKKGSNEKSGKSFKSSKRGKSPPVIFDTDYGPFIDDVFALGLIANSADVIDLKYVLSTGETNPALGAQCVAKQLQFAGRNDVPVGVGSKFPDEDDRAVPCRSPFKIGFALEEKCKEGVNMDVDTDGIAAIAELLESSDRDDWVYIVIGAQTSLKSLVENYPAAAAKMSTLIVMGANLCADFEPYPDVMAPTEETNIACDPAAANDLLDANFSPFDDIYYVPAVVADEIGGEDYIKIVEAANSGVNPGAAATLDYYRAWSEAGRADPTLLIHAEALKYDPETESTPQFDACAVMLAIDLLGDESCEDRLSLFNLDGIHFLEAGDDGLKPFPDGPRAAFSLLEGSFDIENSELPDQCPALTDFTFNPSDTIEEEMPVTVALGFNSQSAKESFYGEMAERIAGTFGGTTKSPKCY